MAEKTLVELKSAMETTAQNALSARELASVAAKEAQAKPDDKNLKKKAEGLTAAAVKKEEAAKAAYESAAEAAERNGTEAQSANTGTTETDEKNVSLRIKHKSTGDFYYRCGLRFKKDFETYTVPESKAERLKTDPYIMFEDRR